MKEERGNPARGRLGRYQRASALSIGHVGRNAARHSPSFNYGAVAARSGKKGNGAPRKSNFKSSARGPTADLIKFSRKKKNPPRTAPPVTSGDRKKRDGAPRRPPYCLHSLPLARAGLPIHSRFPSFAIITAPRHAVTGPVTRKTNHRRASRNSRPATSNAKVGRGRAPWTSAYDDFSGAALFARLINQISGN